MRFGSRASEFLNTSTKCIDREGLGGHRTGTRFKDYARMSLGKIQVNAQPIRHFEIARETESRWLSKFFVLLFCETILPPC